MKCPLAVLLFHQAGALVRVVPVKVAVGLFLVPAAYDWPRRYCSLGQAMIGIGARGKIGQLGLILGQELMLSVSLALPMGLPALHQLGTLLWASRVSSPCPSLAAGFPLKDLVLCQLRLGQPLALMTYRSAEKETVTSVGEPQPVEVYTPADQPKPTGPAARRHQQ